jgi:SAM-dependent methyltransferase
VPTYNPAIFNVRTIAEAKRIILTAEDVGTEKRWQAETPYLMGLIRENLKLDCNSLVIDYGCGIGRLSKALIEEYGCRVVGADISASMRGLAASYVGSDRFFACSPDWLKFFAPSSFWEADAAISVWTLQHCLDPDQDIANIRVGLGPRAQLFVVNSVKRLVPTVESGWTGDAKNIGELLELSFGRTNGGTLDVAFVGDDVARDSFWAVYQR